VNLYRERLTPIEIRRKLDDLLPHVEKPSRYFAGEIGISRKNWEGSQARIAIAFPDIYEIALGNLGHQLILHILNSRDNVLAERVYAPWPDMEKLMREGGIPLYSLESFRAVAEFDVLGVSLTHELAFSNLLLLIDLAGLHHYASERGFPIIIAGGTSVFNPEPIAPFVDAVVLGDGEEVVLDLAGSIARHRAEIDEAGGNIEAEKELKKKILAEWGGAEKGNRIEGLYVPAHFEVEYKEDGRISSISNIADGPSTITKALVSNLEDSPWVCEPPLSHMQGVASRATIEPVRGCTRGCRFCQAGMIYRPYRMRSTQLLLEQAEHILESTGHQELSFLALSATDWPGLEEFIRGAMAPDRGYHLRISLPSGRIASLTQNITDMLAPNRKGGLTLAIEAATERLRTVINKEMTDDEIVLAVKSAAISGWSAIKFYFMIGLPTETDDDVLAIVGLIERMVELHRSLKKEHPSKVSKMKFTVSVSSFVPKSHTPFQWVAMDSGETLDRKQRLLLELRKFKNVEYNSHDIESSLLEGVLARGDRRLGGVIERAFNLGARFDAWGDMSKPEVWRQAFKEEGLNEESYMRAHDLDEVLPWEHLTSGVSKEWLQEEWLSAVREERTPDCNESKCMSCGMAEVYPECRPQRIVDRG
jgi:radical SAM family uncharacterized protein